MPLAEVFAAIEKQTGNKLIDNRERTGRAAAAETRTITIELKDEPFWPALDQILDQAKLGIYSYGGEDALSIVAARRRRRPAHGRASYGGPFRFEVLEVQAQRNLRQPQRRSRSSCNWKSPGSRGCGRSRFRSRLADVTGDDRRRRRARRQPAGGGARRRSARRHAGGRNHAAVRAAAARREENHHAPAASCRRSCRAGR